MADITERLRDAATIHVQLAGQSALATTIRDGADEIDRLRARVAELEAERDPPASDENFLTDVYGQLCEMLEPHVIREGKVGGTLPGSVVDSFRILLNRHSAELEAAKVEPVAWTVSGHSLLISHEEWKKHGLVDGIPLYTAPPAPTVDVDAISDERIQSGSEAYFAECLRLGIMGEQSTDRYIRCMRAVLRAIFNKGE